MSQETFRALAEDNQLQPSTRPVHLSQNHHGCGDSDIAHGSHSRLGSADESLGLEDRMLGKCRVETFLADPDAPLTISAEMFQVDAHRKRALAEIDGIVAGLKFLDKMERLRTVSTGAWALDDQTEMLRGLPAEIARGLRLLLSLIRAVEAEFQRFNDMASGSASPIIRDLRNQIPSSRALIDRGTLVYRDVLDDLPPNTLADVFASFSVFHAISAISVHRKPMEEAQVLSGVQRWRDRIRDVDAKGAFDILATEMWPSIMASSPQRGWPSLSGLDGEDHLLPFPNGQDDTLSFLQHAAPVAPDRIDLLYQNLPLAGEFGIPPANLDEGLYPIEQDIFALLSSLDGGDDNHLARQSNDTRDLIYYCNPNEPIPGYNPSLLNYPPNQAITPPLPPPTPLTRGRRHCKVQITDKVSDCAAANLRNTAMFLSVLAFAKDASQCFYLLSGSGRTVEHSRTGCVRAMDRSKTERKLRETFFGPLKKTCAGNACFLAILAMAKRFQARGSLWSGEKVLDYLFTISMWAGPPQTGTGGMSVQQQQQPQQQQQQQQQQQRKRRNRSDGQMADCSTVSKKQRLFCCDQPGCEKTYQDSSGLSKHKRKHAGEDQPVFRCEQCPFTSDRRDNLRQHFLKNHGTNLPPSLKEKRRGHV